MVRGDVPHESTVVEGYSHAWYNANRQRRCQFSHGMQMTRQCGVTSLYAAGSVTEEEKARCIKDAISKRSVNLPITLLLRKTRMVFRSNEYYDFLFF